MNLQANESIRQYAHLADLMELYTQLVGILLIQNVQEDVACKKDVLADIETIAGHIFENIQEFEIAPIFVRKGV